jgi:flagellar basal-body rod protein FlgG
MERGLYIAASGMLTELIRQDQIAHDLANASTPGYKAERSTQQSFGELLLANRSTGETVGPLGLGAAITGVRTDLTQAPLRETGEPLDVALAGSGFFAVRSPDGVRYTRAGQFALGANGTLTTATGLPVLDDRGQPIVVKGGDPTIAADGTVSVNGRSIAKLGIVDLRNPLKQGDTLFAGTPAGRPAQTAIKQGFLEGSGVQPAQAMVDMMTSMRAFESVQRVIRTIDETLQKGISTGGGSN